MNLMDALRTGISFIASEDKMKYNLLATSLAFAVTLIFNIIKYLYLLEF